ncbi:MAG: right-handed parallel beta-helix repeat-containing protein [Anaerolineaceae bacterium]|nr:right-handed parallel beta-helix repeat-containing protein [Anaerolineaceae bacterium]
MKMPLLRKYKTVLFIFFISSLCLFNLLPLFQTASSYLESTADFVVNSESDAGDIQPGDGLCNTSMGTCTLRAAVQEANAYTGTQTIFLPTGTYTLTLPGKNEDLAATGDLDIKDDLQLLGDAIDIPTINGGASDRIFQIFPTISAHFENVNVRNGFLEDMDAKGGAILSSGHLTIKNVTVRDNFTTGLGGGGGGIYSSGVITIENSLIDNNATKGQNAFGGGIAAYGRFVLVNSTVSHNKTSNWNTHGAGIYLSNSTSVITNSNILSNTAGTVGVGGGNGNGAGIYQFSGIQPPATLSIVDSTLAHNISDGFGGGLFSWGDVTITRTTFFNNHAANGASGGAIRGMYESMAIWDSFFDDNYASNEGGAIVSVNTLELTVYNSVFTNNYAGGSGGAISASWITKIFSSTFHSNESSSGGAIYMTLNLLTLENSAIYDNFSKAWGGGITTWTGSSANIANSTISGNRANLGGGGIATSASSAKLNNVTLVNNIADFDQDNAGDGGGLFGTIFIKNSIIANNQDLSSNIQHPDCSSGTSSQGFNLVSNTDGCNLAAVEGDHYGTSDNPIDPLLGPLQNNGGPTFSHLPVTDSPVIDAGNPSEPGSEEGSCAIQDQRFFNRPEDGNQDGTFVCDIGSVERLIIEVPPTPTATPTLTPTPTYTLTPTPTSTSTLQPTPTITLTPTPTITLVPTTTEWRIYLPLLQNP